MNKPKIYISHAFLAKNQRVPDEWRIGIWKHNHGVMAYAAGETENEAKANAKLIVEALGAVFTLPGN